MCVIRVTISLNDSIIPDESKSISVLNLDVTPKNKTCSVSSPSVPCQVAVQPGTFIILFICSSYLAVFNILQMYI